VSEDEEIGRKGRAMALLTSCLFAFTGCWFCGSVLVLVSVSVRSDLVSTPVSGGGRYCLVLAKASIGLSRICE
jgi:hypothetical protein